LDLQAQLNKPKKTASSVADKNKKSKTGTKALTAAEVKAILKAEAKDQG
jgi:hypothetical protein